MDVWQGNEVVVWWWVGGSLFEGVIVVLWVVDGDDFVVVLRFEDVLNQWDNGSIENEGEDCGDLVVNGEVVGFKVVSVLMWYIYVVYLVLDQEGVVEVDEGQLEVNFVKMFVEYMVGYFWELEVEVCESGEYNCIEQGVVEVSNQEVGFC